MLREVLIEAPAEFGYGLLDVFVEGGDNRANLFFGDGFIVRVEVGPHRMPVLMLRNSISMVTRPTMEAPSTSLKS